MSMHKGLLVGLGVLAASLLIAATPAETKSADPAVQAAGDSHYTVYYLHGTRRCHTCRTIEEEADRAVHRFFSEPLEAGTLQWQVLNMEEKENRHFVKEFGLVSSSLVVAEIKAGKVVRFQVLQDVWKLSGDSMRFAKYVKDSMDEFFSKNS